MAVWLGLYVIPAPCPAFYDVFWCWSISRSLLRILKNCRIKFILCHVRFLKNWIVYTGFNGSIALDRKYLTYVDLCCQVFSNIFFEINSFKFESVKWQFQITLKSFKQSEVISLESFKIKCQNRVQIQCLTELKSDFFNASDLRIPLWLQLQSNKAWACKILRLVRI